MPPGPVGLYKACAREGSVGGTTRYYICDGGSVRASQNIFFCNLRNLELVVEVYLRRKWWGTSPFSGIGAIELLNLLSAILSMSHGRSNCALVFGGA